MIVMTREPDAPADYMLQDFLSFDTPDGYRAELIDGEIVVTPPPNGNHELCIGLIVEQVLSQSAARMHFSGHKGLIASAGKDDAGGRVIPDITFAPAELDVFRDAPSWMLAEGVAMVVEVTSSRPRLDRDAKRRAYAGAKIPLYLLVDRQHGQITLFSHPKTGDYRRTNTARSGDKLDLPEPFAFTLDTAAFVD